MTFAARSAPARSPELLSAEGARATSAGGAGGSAATATRVALCALVDDLDARADFDAAGDGFGGSAAAASVTGVVDAGSGAVRDRGLPVSALTPDLPAGGSLPRAT
ncbi:MAG: hypothetical protein KIS78_35925, partial [Labilithrix sp.]|nr:hypothetical protein [Labilithrix sp.]